MGKKSSRYRPAACTADSAPLLEPSDVNCKNGSHSGQDGFTAAAAEDQVHVLQIPPGYLGHGLIAHGLALVLLDRDRVGLRFTGIEREKRTARIV